jgi:hypothetical protein
VVSAPLLVVPHDIVEYAIHLHNDVHFHQLCQLNFSGLNNGSDDLDGESIEFLMIDFKVLENDLDQLQFVQDHNECAISFYDHRKQL